MKPILEAVNIHKSFKKDGRVINVIKGVSIKLYEGEIVSIIGPSGVGKSTLLHILGLLDTPTSGSILFMGKEVGWNESELASFRNSAIGFVFQHHYLLNELSALENVMLPCLISGMPYKEAKDKASEALSKVHLLHRLNHKPGELSGGEQQRVALARALVKEPYIVLADEPTGNLDRETTNTIINLILEINLKNKTSFLIVTHDMELANIANRKYKMVDGKLEMI